MDEDISMNKDWTKKMLQTPNAENTPGLFFHRPFFDSRYGYGTKIYVKNVVNGLIRYCFDAIFYWPHQKRKISSKWLE